MEKTDWLQFRIEPALKAAFKQAAEAVGMTLSAWTVRAGREKLARDTAVEQNKRSEP